MDLVVESFEQDVEEYRRQLEQGAVKRAYRGLMEYIMALRTHLANKYPDYFVSGLYYGYMDMTYFSFFPRSLKERGLKVAIVFIHETCRFEVWLAGYNKQVQSRYWRLLQDSHWTKYPVVPAIEGADSIVEHVLVAQPNFDDLDALTKQLERAALKFITEVEAFVSKHA